MNLVSLEARSPIQLASCSADAFICASGFESRARHVARVVKPSASKYLSLGFQELRDNEARQANDDYFRKCSFQVVGVSGDDEETPAELLREIVGLKEKATVVIDISSMTRAWYGAFVRQIRSSSCRELTVYFCYAPSKYRRSPGKYPQNRFVRPMRGFAAYAPPSRPPALILGLGDHIGRALGIYLEVDPWVAAVFQASPTLDPRYERSVQRANADLLSRVDQRLMFTYPLLDFPTTFHRLCGVTRSLAARESAVILACTGPKVLSLACLLVSSVVSTASVWRVSAGDREGSADVKAAGPVVICKTVWQSEGN